VQINQREDSKQTQIWEKKQIKYSQCEHFEMGVSGHFVNWKDGSICMLLLLITGL
jgi:hypothetical protein